MPHDVFKGQSPLPHGSRTGNPKKGADPNLCARCAEVNPTCCRLKPGEEEHCFPLSEMERDRILDVAGETGAFVQMQNTSQFTDNIKALFPGDEELVERLFPTTEHKVHLRLAITPKGACVFLSPSGCTLPRDTRPYYCRLFPFWVLGEQLVTFEARRCLVSHQARSPREGLRLVGLTEPALRELHGRLRLAWGLPPKTGMELLPQSFTRYSRVKNP